jgi:hypothetical protein
MKKAGIFLIILLYINIPAQQQTKEQVLQWVSWGVFAGPDFTSAPGASYSILLEGRARIIPRVNLKISCGYSSLNQDKNLSVKTYWLPKINNVTYYQTHSYDIEVNNYMIFPFSAGLEYYIAEGGISPYLMFEIGNNIYSTGVSYSNNVYGSLQEYTGSDDVPAEYRSGRRIILGRRSFRTAIGLGTKIKLYGPLNFEVRYLYNVNTAIINSHRLLMGLSI